MFSSNRVEHLFMNIRSINAYHMIFIVKKKRERFNPQI